MPKLNIIESLWNGKSSGDVGNALILLGAIGWFFSAAAQIVMLVRNNDIDKKEKKFLIPQESTDGVINCALYYTVCQSIKKYGDNIVEKGNYITSKMNKFIRIMNTDSREQDSLVRGFSETFNSLGITKSKKQKEYVSNFFDGIMNYVKNEIPENITLDKNMSEAFERLANGRTVSEQIDLIKSTRQNFQAFKNGAGILTAVGASVLTGNIITPIARNITANYFQRKFVNRQKALVNSTEINNNIPTKQLITHVNTAYSLPKPTAFRNFHI